MKDTRFIELINLYIDRQISPVEAAELEAEIQANPRRRQVYQQYCKMHTASRLVYESFRTDAEPAAAAVSQPGTIARFETRQRAARRTRWAYAASSFAAAACLGLGLFYAGSLRQESNATVAPAMEVAAVAPAAVAQPATVVAPRAQTNSNHDAMLASLRQQEQQRIAVGELMKSAPAQSLFDDGVFDNDSSRAFQLKPRDQKAAAEFTAFQFQR